jgi:hypothetical protein
MNGPRPGRRQLSIRSTGWAAVFLLVAAATLAPAATANNSPGNDGTLKIHEQGTPVGTKNNDPKVCIFNVEGFNFDSGQTGYIMFDVQGGDGPHGTSRGPINWGPANSQGRYDTEYFNLDPGHYKATLYGKTVGKNGQTKIDIKAKSKVFKVKCGEENPATPTPPNNPATPTPTPPATPTPTPPVVTPTPGGSDEGEQGTPTPTPHKTPKPTGGVSGATGTPHLTLPPTDTLETASGERTESWRGVLLALAALLAVVLVMTPRRGSTRRR